MTNCFIEHRGLLQNMSTKHLSFNKFHLTSTTTKKEIRLLYPLVFSASSQRWLIPPLLIWPQVFPRLPQSLLAPHSYCSGRRRNIGSCQTIFNHTMRAIIMGKCLVTDSFGTIWASASILTPPRFEVMLTIMDISLRVNDTSSLSRWCAYVHYVILARVQSILFWKDARGVVGNAVYPDFYHWTYWLSNVYEISLHIVCCAKPTYNLVPYLEDAWGFRQEDGGYFEIYRGRISLAPNACSSRFYEGYIIFTAH